MQKPHLLTNEQIEELAKKWQTEFCWNFGYGCKFGCCYDQGESSFLLVWCGIPLRSYNFKYLTYIKNYFDAHNHAYYIAKPLTFSGVSPQKLKSDDLILLLSNKRFIFYTGAGISAAGNIATLSELGKSFGIDKGVINFIKEIFLHPRHITDTFSTFCKSAIDKSPTAAHDAVHHIAQYRNIAIVTENVDLLQQRTGSEPIFTHSDAFYAIKPSDLQEVDIVVCVGLSHDDCGFLSWYKKHNPAGILIAMNLEQPDYLSEHDFLVQKDLQSILPKLAHILCNL